MKSNTMDYPGIVRAACDNSPGTFNAALMCFSLLRALALAILCCVMTDSVAANRLGLKRHPRFLRPEKIALTESLVELRMARRYGWNLDMLRGKLSTPEAKRGDSYRLLNPRPFLFQPRPRIDVVRLSHWLRFGNAVRQLKNVFYVAEQLGAETVEFAELHPFLKVSLPIISSLSGAIDPARHQRL